jgi:hypothetical protein
MAIKSNPHSATEKDGDAEMSVTRNGRHLSKFPHSILFFHRWDGPRLEHHGLSRLAPVCDFRFESCIVRHTHTPFCEISSVLLGSAHQNETTSLASSALGFCFTS